MMSRALRALVLLGLGLGACTQSGFSTGVGESPTAVVVDPAEFLGDVVCLDAEGAMRRYVATLVDVSPVPLVTDAGDVTLPSSAPTECWKSVHFQRVTLYRDYVAEIDGYDRTDIRPLSPGSRIQVDAAGQYVPPRWTTSCGRMEPLEPEDGGNPPDAGDAGEAGDAPPPPPPESSERDATAADGGEPPSTLGRSCTVVSASDAAAPSREGPACSVPRATVVVRSCAPLVDSGGAPSRTGVSVDLGALPGVTPCGTDGGVTSFQVRLRGAAEPPSQATCGDEVMFDDLIGGTAYTVEVTALDGSGQPTASTTCFRRAVRGLVLPAACDPLTPTP